MLIDASCTGALSSLPAPRLYPVEAFRNAIAAAGLTPPDDIIPDGKLHRFASDGRRGDDAGWYVLHLDGVPAGAFGCWREGFTRQWCSKTQEAMTPAEREAYRRKLQAMRQQRDADTAQRQQEAAQVAARRWQAAAPATAEHPYLSAKGVQAHGVRLEGEALLIPMRDTAGTLHSLQVIGPEGGKRFQPGGRVKGCYHAIGKPEGVLIVCEGYATGASIHEATGCAVAVAFNAGNLEPVALALRSKYPDARLIVAADDDWRKEGNPGLTKASAAARAAGARLAVPRFPADRPDKATDFNDLHKLAGLQAVAACIEAAAPTLDDTQAAPAGEDIEESGAPCVFDQTDAEDLLQRAQRRLQPDIGEHMPAYPVQALGPLADVCRAIAEGKQVEPAIVGNGLLATAALLTSGLWDVESLDGDRRPLALYTLTVAVSGAGKDTSDREVTHAVRNWQKRANEAYLNARREYEAALSARKKGEPPPEPPTAPHLLCSDMTVEGLRRAYAEGVPVQGVFSTEAASVLAGHGFSADHRAKTAGVLCDLWDRGLLSVVRGGAGRFERYDLRLNAHLAIQPAAVHQAIGDPLLANIGLWPRFLLAWPAAPKPRQHRRWLGSDDERVRWWWGRCDELLEMTLPEGGRVVIGLHRAARQALAAFFEECERRAARGGDLWDVRPFALRAAEQATRIAGVLAAIRGHAQVQQDDAHGGIELARYSVEGWRVALAGRIRDRAADDALLLLRWLLQRPGCRASATEIIRSGPRALRSAQARDAALDRLQQIGLAHFDGGTIVVASDEPPAPLAKAANAAKSLEPQRFETGECVAKTGESPPPELHEQGPIRHFSPTVRQAPSLEPQGFSPDSPLSPGLDAGIALSAVAGDGPEVF